MHFKSLLGFLLLLVGNLPTGVESENPPVESENTTKPFVPTGKEIAIEILDNLEKAQLTRIRFRNYNEFSTQNLHHFSLKISSNSNSKKKGNCADSGLLICYESQLDRRNDGSSHGRIKHFELPDKGGIFEECNKIRKDIKDGEEWDKWTEAGPKHGVLITDLGLTVGNKHRFSIQSSFCDQKDLITVDQKGKEAGFELAVGSPKSIVADVPGSGKEIKDPFEQYNNGFTMAGQCKFRKDGSLNIWPLYMDMMSQMKPPFYLLTIPLNGKNAKCVPKAKIVGKDHVLMPGREKGSKCAGGKVIDGKCVGDEGVDWGKPVWIKAPSVNSELLRAAEEYITEAGEGYNRLALRDASGKRTSGPVKPDEEGTIAIQFKEDDYNGAIHRMNLTFAVPYRNIFTVYKLNQGIHLGCAAEHFENRITFVYNGLENCNVSLVWVDNYGTTRVEIGASATNTTLIAEKMKVSIVKDRVWMEDTDPKQKNSIEYGAQLGLEVPEECAVNNPRREQFGQQVIGARNPYVLHFSLLVPKGGQECKRLYIFFDKNYELLLLANPPPPQREGEE